MTFSLEPILLELEGERYVGPLLPMPLAELVSRRHGSSGSGGIISRGGGNGDGCDGDLGRSGGSSGSGGRDGGKGGGTGWGALEVEVEDPEVP